MIEQAGDLWDAWVEGHWIAITTNPTRDRYGKLVMGRGCALEAKQRFPDLPKFLGDWCRDNGNVPTAHFKYRLFTFPVKHHWRERADLALIVTSARRLVTFARQLLPLYPKIFPLFTVRPGCGNGGLQWPEVRSALAPILNDDFVIVERASVFDRQQMQVP